MGIIKQVTGVEQGNYLQYNGTTLSGINNEYTAISIHVPQNISNIPALIQHKYATTLRKLP